MTIPFLHAGHWIDKLQLLLKLRQSIKARLEPKFPRFNPFQVLPFELIKEIFSHLTFKETMPCLAVCRQWNHILQNDGQLYSVLDLWCIPRLKASSVESYIKKSKGKLRMLRVSNDLSLSSLKFHFTFCHQLQTLCIHSKKGLLSILPTARNLKQIRLVSHVSDPSDHSLDELLELMMQFTALESFSARVSTTIASSPIGLSSRVGPNGSLASMKSLSLTGPVRLSADKVFMWNGVPIMDNLGQFHAFAIPLVVSSGLKWPDSLRSLGLSCPQPRSSEAWTFHLPHKLTECMVVCGGHGFSLRGTMPPLQTLSLHGYRSGLNHDCWAAMEATLSKLSLFDIICDESTGGIDEILNSTQNLSELRIETKWRSVFCERHLRLIVQRNPKLELLGMPYFSDLSITSTMIMTLVQGLEFLKTLYIDFVEPTGVFDCLAWLKSKGIEVWTKVPNNIYTKST